MTTSNIRIIFMGTPEFAVAPLQAIKSAGINIVGVVTAPDKPAGRGKKLTSPAVKIYAEKALACPVLQPEKLKDPSFIRELAGMKADLFIVVAFRMLPEAVWSLPEHGTINLHASLLPQYRGAAPINWCIINGEEATGLTTFLIDREIDTGRILLQEKMTIGPDENAGALHDRMMETGAKLVVRTIKQVIQGTVAPVPQEAFNIPADQLKKAPKIFKPDCRINWSNDSATVHNFVRGLSPFPGAFTHLVEPDGEHNVLKVFATKRTGDQAGEQTWDQIGEAVPGTLHSDNSTSLKVMTGDGWLELESLQAAGKKRMAVGDFLRGFRGNINDCRVQ